MPETRRIADLPREVQLSLATPLNLIVDRLYLGNLYAAIYSDILQEHGITHIVSVIEADVVAAPNSDSYIRHHIVIADNLAADIVPHLLNACAFIDGALLTGGTVLVHCHQGQSRSASLVVAWLMRHSKIDYNSALMIVKKARPCAKPNSRFEKDLLSMCY